MHHIRTYRLISNQVNCNVHGSSHLLNAAPLTLLSSPARQLGKEYCGRDYCTCSVLAQAAFTVVQNTQLRLQHSVRQDPFLIAITQQVFWYAANAYLLASAARNSAPSLAVGTLLGLAHHFNVFNFKSLKASDITLQWKDHSGLSS